MSHKVSEIKGVGPQDAAKFQREQIHTVDDLINRAQTHQQRTELAKRVGVPPQQFAEWHNRASLMRLKGISTEMANLLEESGVESVKELQHRKADTLTIKLKETNETKHLTHRIPSHDQVQEWIVEARTLATTSAL